LAAWRETFSDCCFQPKTGSSVRWIGRPGERLATNVHDYLVAPVWLAVNVILVWGMRRLPGGLAAGDSFVEKVQHTLAMTLG